MVMAKTHARLITSQRAMGSALETSSTLQPRRACAQLPNLAPKLAMAYLLSIRPPIMHGSRLFVKIDIG